MKLRNLLLTAALFLTAGIVSAVSPIESTDVTNEDGTVIRTDYSWPVPYDKQGKPTTVTMIRYNSQGNSDSWSYQLYAVSGEAKDWTYNLVESTADSYVKEGNKRIYTFTLNIPYDENGVPAVTSIGVKGRDGGDSAINIPVKKGHFHFYETEDGALAFGKGGNNVKAEFTFGQPLPAPVVTLLIALGFGAALVMYRNRKQVKA